LVHGFISCYSAFGSDLEVFDFFDRINHVGGIFIFFIIFEVKIGKLICRVTLHYILTHLAKKCIKESFTDALSYFMSIICVQSLKYFLMMHIQVGGWKEDVITDPITGKCSRSESFIGYEKMKIKKEQTYLGDLLSNDGSRTKNVQQRSNKGLGAINQITQILESTFFGKYYFEVGVVLRESLFLSSLLLNSEAWVNYSDKDVRILEQCDEILLSKILDCNANTSNALKYLELGIFPVRFEIITRCPKKMRHLFSFISLSILMIQFYALHGH
jgi:hypothetical protein